MKQVDPAKVFLVRAGKSYQQSGAEAFIQAIYQNIKPVYFNDFDPNPQLKDLVKGIELFKTGNFEHIIAIGGGSVLDMAKLISMFAHQTETPENFIQGKAELKKIKTPLLAIPTTAGSGAEATGFAVIYIDKQKYSVAHALMLPDIVYLDAAFSFSASKYLTSCTGIDALCQAIESVWSVNTTSQSQAYALQAIESVWKNLKNAVLHQDIDAKENMQFAAFLAGKSINLTKTTAPHALSYAFTSFYGIPHGHAVALSLPFFLHFNYHLNENNCADPRGVNAVKLRIDKILKILDIDIDEAQQTLIDFFENIGIIMRIPSLINEFNPDIVVDNVNVERLSNNPRRVSKNDIVNFLKT